MKLSDGQHFIRVENEKICSHKKADSDYLVDSAIVRQVEKDLEQLYAVMRQLLDRIKVLSGSKPWHILAVPLKLEID